MIQTIKRYLETGESIAKENLKFATKELAQQIDICMSSSTRKIHRIWHEKDQILAHLEASKNNILTAEMVLFKTKEIDNSIQINECKIIKQNVPTMLVGKHTMFDGRSNLDQVANTEMNQKQVLKFLEEVWINGNMDLLETYFDKSQLIQHNPQVADDTVGLYAFLKHLEKQDVTLKYNKVIEKFAIKDFVCTYSEGLLGNEEYLFADLFRLEKNKIVEHWDVIQKK